MDQPWEVGNDSDGGESLPDDAASEAPVGLASAPRPSTRAEMSKLHDQYKNTLHLVSLLYHDISLRDEMRMVSLATHAYHEEYSLSLVVQAEGQESDG